MSDDEKALMVKMPEGVVELVPDCVGHMVEYKTTGGYTRTIYCEKFYVAGQFTVFEGVRVEDCHTSMRPRNVLYHNCRLWRQQRKGQVVDPYFNIDEIGSESKAFACYETKSIRTVPTRNVGEIGSIRKGDKAPIWTMRDYKTAKKFGEEWAVEAEKGSQKSNREYLHHKLIPEYKRYISIQAFFEMRDKLRLKWFRKMDRLDETWLDSYLERNQINLEPLKEMVKKSGVTFGIDIDDLEWW